MADFTNSRDSVANMAAANQGINMGTTGGMHDTDYATDDLWNAHDSTFREEYASRPYARADRSYEYYQPAYRYGVDAGRRHAGRAWDDVSGDLERGWDRARGRSEAAWDDVKHAVHDAFDRIARR